MPKISGRYMVQCKKCGRVVPYDEAYDAYYYDLCSDCAPDGWIAKQKAFFAKRNIL